MKNLLAFLTKYKAKKAELEELKNEVETMGKELNDYIFSNYERDENGKIKFTYGQYTITVSHCERVDIDKKRLEQELPDIAKQYEKITEYDRTTVR